MFSFDCLSFKWLYFLQEQCYRKLIFVQNIRTISASAEEQGLKFSIYVMYKIAANVAQLAYCILLHAYSLTVAVSSCASTLKIHKAYLKLA